MSEPVDMSYWYERCMKAEQERDQLKAERDEAQRQRDILLKHDSEKVAALKAELARIRDSACSVCGYPRQRHGEGLGLTEEEANSYIPCEYCFLKRELDRIREAEEDGKLPEYAGDHIALNPEKYTNVYFYRREDVERQLRETRAALAITQGERDRQYEFNAESIVKIASLESALAVAQQTNKKLQEYTVHGKHCDGNHCECRLEQLEQLTGEAR